MKKTPLIFMMSIALIATAAHAGDPVAGKAKAAGCVVCHGSENFGGLFYTLQLAGRDADKLAVKTNKYKTLKVLHPVMNMVTAFYTEKEIEDITAYYQSIGKPFLTSPFIKIKGDEDADKVTMADTPTPASGHGKVATTY